MPPLQKKLALLSRYTQVKMVGSGPEFPGSSSSYKVSSFVDISNTVAGKNDSARLALAGTYSHISSGTPTIPYGYNEINIISDKLGEWKVTTSRNSYQFANLSNYASTRLPRASINGLQILESDGKKYLFALTSFKGLWSVSLDSRRPYWKGRIRYLSNCRLATEVFDKVENISKTRIISQIFPFNFFVCKSFKLMAEIMYPASSHTCINFSTPVIWCNW